MWVLIQERTGETFPMFPNIQYKVGRLSADLVLKDDKSVSGMHAYLIAKNYSGVNFIELKDSGSKNGTFVNDNIENMKPLKKNSTVKLIDGDRLQFGVMGNSWRACYKSICSVSSGLTSQESEKLEVLLDKCGGKHVSTFNKFSTHLTMKEIKVTLKVMNALLAEIPIVTFDFWKDLVKVARKEQKGPMVSIENYLPRITDVLLAQQDVDFRNRQERKSVFAGKTFVFLSQKHYETYSPIVEKAGGCTRGLKSGVQKAFLLKKNVVVVQYIPSTESQNSQGTQTINTIAEYLEANSRRFIPEYEIALAIVHCSTQKYCNPDYKIVCNMISSTSTLQDSESVIVENTSAINVQADTESCDLLILETESSQDAKPKLLSEVLPLDGKSLILNKNDSNISLSASLNSKRRNNVMSSSSESEAEFSPLAKKICVDQPVVKKNQMSNTSSASDKKDSPKQSSYKALNVTVSKTPKQIHNRCPPMPDLSDDEDDLFNFEDNTSSSPARKKKRTDSPSNELHGSRLASLKTKSMNAIDTLNVDENYNDSIPTQPFMPKSVPKSTTTSLPTPKILPHKLSTEGWTTFTVKNDTEISLKTEVNQEHNVNIKDETAWCISEAVKCAFRIHSFKVFHKETNVSTASSIGNFRCFKKFAKQKVFQRQL